MRGFPDGPCPVSFEDFASAEGEIYGEDNTKFGAYTGMGGPFGEFVFNLSPGAGVKRLEVNKQTHRIRFEGETEDSVTIVIEPK